MRFSLVYKLIFAISIFILITMTVAVFYPYNKITGIIEDQVRAYFASIAEFAEGQIFLFFETIKIRTADWSSDGYIREMTEKIAKGNYFAKDVENLNKHLIERKMPLDPTVKLIDVLSPEMVVITSSEPKRIGLVDDEHVAPKKEKVLKAGFGQVLIDNLENEEMEMHYHPTGLLIHAMTPIKSLKTGETVGVLLLHLTGETMNQILSGVWQVKLGAQTGQEFTARLKTAEIYLVNEEKLIITPSRFIENAPFRQKADMEPVRKCLEKNEEFNGEFTDYRGVKVQGASMCFADYKMTLVAQVDSEEIFSPLKKERNDFVFVIVFLWIISVLISFLFIRFSLKNIKILSGVAVLVSRGDFSARANVKSNDELGDLGKTFDAMLDNIERSEVELKKTNEKLRQTYLELEKSAALLEDKVKARTKELEDVKMGLEVKVHEKTMELQNQIDELEKFKKMTLGRELRMIELKKEIEELKKNYPADNQSSINP